MTKNVIKNSINKNDLGHSVSSSAEMLLVDHSDYGLKFALVSSGSSTIAGLYDDLAKADIDRKGFTNIESEVKPIDMADSVSVKRASKKSVKIHFMDEQTISKYLVKCTKVLYDDKTSI